MSLDSQIFWQKSVKFQSRATKLIKLFFKIENAVEFVYETSRFESQKVEMHMKTKRTSLVSCGMVKNLTCWFSDYEIKFEKISGH